MKEKLVSFETAKLLKEKGFGYDIVNDPTNKYGFHKSYYLRQFPTYSCSPSGEIRFDVIQNNSTAFKDLLYDYTEGGNEYGHHEYLAPTQALAQKWLRKKHNIDISIIPNYAHYKNGGLTGQKTYRLGIYYTENGLIDCFFIRPPDDKDLFIEYNIYEEALEEGLKQGLMLIK